MSLPTLWLRRGSISTPGFASFCPAWAAWLIAAIGAIVPVSAQPLAPSAEQLAAIPRHQRIQFAGPGMGRAIPSSLSVDTASREEVRLFFRAIYPASENVPMEWTGNYTATDALTAAGATSTAFKEAVNLRVNFFRALAGVPGDVTFDATFNAKAQQAALMMSANDALSHTPPVDWLYYTADGAQAAGSSNLALGTAGPAAIDGYIADPGASNSAVGHRRWLLYPQTENMGTGDVAGDASFDPANALWVFDGNFGGARPFVRESFVAWPPPGYVPYQVVYPRWSLSYPNADFSGATVTMTRNGSAIPVALEPVANGYGENTLVWVYDGLNVASAQPHTRPTSDVTYSVTVANAVINGQSQTLDYDVIVFDPDVPGSDHDPIIVSGSANPDLNGVNTYSVSGLYYATGFQWRLLSSAPYNAVEGGENGTAGLTVSTTGSYDVLSTSLKATGDASFHLAHATTATQYVQLAPTFLGASESQIVFQSRLGYATSTQVARVQVSLDEGATWSDVYTQAGSGGAGESGFTLRTVSLAHLAGRTFHVRFAYTFSGGSYFGGSADGTGWYFDEIALTGVEAVTTLNTSATATSSQFGFTPTAAGTFALQARGIFYGQYALAWGAVKPVTVTAAPPHEPVITTQPASQTVNPGETVTFTVVATGSPSPSYQWRRNGIVLTGATGATLMLLNVQASDAATYSVVVTNSAGSVTSAGAVLTVDATLRAPTITTQPAPVSAVVGGKATFTVGASGYPTPTYVWRRNGSPIPQATASSYTIVGVQAGDAGTYSVTVSNSQGSVTSADAALTVHGSIGITTQPANQTIASGSTATLSVAATGTDLSYQWFAGVSGDTSAPIPGATAATFTTPALTLTSRYWVQVSSPAQQIASSTAVVTVVSSSRFFFGNFGSDQTGTFGLMVRPNNSAVFLASLPDSGGWIQEHFTVSGAGAFSFTPTSGGVGTISGQITGGNVAGTVAGSSLAFSGTRDDPSGSTGALAGLYQSVMLNTSDGELTIIAGSNGRAFLIATRDGTRSGTRTLVSAGGSINVMLPNGRSVAAVLGPNGHVTGTTTAATTSRTIAGQREDVPVSRRLVNTSMRGKVREGDSLMIAGFVVNGTGHKRVLLRGIGPTLADYGVPGALSDAKIELHRIGDAPGTPPLAENDDWGAASNVAELVNAAQSLYAFDLPNGSKDSALLLDLPAGTYTAHVRGAAGQTGAALVELYDGDTATDPSARLANISMRGEAGTGDNIIIAGFVIGGNAPRRVLIRAVGPELANYGVSGVLSDPVLTVYQRVNGSENLIASNDNWGADGANVAAIADQIDAFSLEEGSSSAALAIWLAPGVYTAQAASSGTSSGITLVEVYEIP